MGVEDTPGKYQLNELDNKLVNALVEMWKKSSLNHLDCEAIELAMELEKPNEIKDWRKIIILKEAFNKFNSSYENVLNLNMQPTQDWEKNGIVYQFTWIKDPNVLKYQPCTQIYGICFTKDKQILLIDNINMRAIPGGTPEEDETPEQTLRRELIEEADVTVSQMFPLGVQMVIEKNNPQKGTYFQYRYVCSIDKLLPQTPDPDNGIIHPRLLVSASEVTSHVKWGITGNAMFKDAIELFKSLDH